MVFLDKAGRVKQDEGMISDLENLVQCPEVFDIAFFSVRREQVRTNPKRG